MKYDMQRWRENGWTWTHNGLDYRTNGEGDGLWYWDDRTGGWKQTWGTCQFGLPSERYKALRVLKQYYEHLFPDCIQERAVKNAETEAALKEEEVSHE